MSNSDLFTISGDSSELASTRELYRWCHDYLPPMATLFNAKLGDVPPGGSVAFSTEESEPLAEHLDEALLTPAERAAMAGLMNDSESSEGSEEQLSEAIANHPAFSGDEVSFALGGDYDGQTGVPKPEVPPLLSYRAERGAFSAFNGRVTKRLNEDKPALRVPADYQVLYNDYLEDSKKVGRFGKKVLGFPGFPELYSSDELFGWQRVAGTNPRVLSRVGSEQLPGLLAKMPVTDAHLQAVAGASDTLAGEAGAGRLFVSDYHLLDGVPTQQGRFLAPAIGVFWSDVRASQLRPVAIQLQQTPGRIHTPSEPGWPSVRAMFQIADFNYHEMGTHLSEAHFSQEAFAIAARRNLSAKHPIGALLAEIYWGLLYNNALGRILLVNPGGYADKMMAGVLETGSLKLVTDYFAKVWRWDDWDLELFLRRQGTDDTAGLPVCPYRDDGLPLWAAIKTFAAEYVSAWYERDAVVANDRELEGFIRELNDPEGGNLADKGFPASVVTKDGLAGVIARLIWQAGPGHAGINYSQYQYFAPIANAAGSGYANCNVEGALPALMDVLPPIEQAIVQADIFNQLTQKVFGLLGEYSKEFRRGLNDHASSAIAQFQTALRHCAAGIDARNETDARRGRSYVWLHPSNLPNSTNI